MKPCRVFKVTSDDWYPSYALDDWYRGVKGQFLVEVSFLKLHLYKEKPEQWRVCVWGADDFGMERDFENKNYAWEMFVQVVSQDSISIKGLKYLGFTNA